MKIGFWRWHDPLAPLLLPDYNGIGYGSLCDFSTHWFFPRNEGYFTFLVRTAFIDCTTSDQLECQFSPILPRNHSVHNETLFGFIVFGTIFRVFKVNLCYFHFFINSSCFGLTWPNMTLVWLTIAKRIWQY